MDDLQFEETGHMPLPNSTQQQLQMKLGRPNDIQKTPSRVGLGMIVNESKTPGARSLQSLASARKTTSSIVKNTIPSNIGFEIFQDEADDEQVEESQQVKTEIEKRPCSPIDTVNRCQNHDSLGADIADDMLNWPDQDVILSEEQPLGNFIDPRVTEDEELASLGVEPWDEYPPIDPASRIADDFNYSLSLDEFRHENDVELEEADPADYPFSFSGMEQTPLDTDKMKSFAMKLLELSDNDDLWDDNDLQADEAAIPI